MKIFLLITEILKFVKKNFSIFKNILYIVWYKAFYREE